MKSEFRTESIKIKFSRILFVYNVTLRCSKKNTRHYPKKLLNKGVKKPGLKFNHGLALIGLRTTGPRNTFKNIITQRA